MAALIRIAFDDTLLPKVEAFDCGSELWQLEVSEWIKGPRGSDGAINDIENGTSVWLYANEAGEVVGFGSLGESVQRWPGPKDLKIPASAIPFMAVERKFWGQPPGSWETRYATQILLDIVAEAQLHRNARKILKLLVYEGNMAAIKLYKRVGFVEFHQPRKDPNGLLYKRMALDLTAEHSA